MNILPIFKKGSLNFWKNWRPIALINTIFRIIDKITASRLKSAIKTLDIISEEQLGYMEGVSTVNQIWRMQQIIEYYRSNAYK